ncbi:hypothetical protein UFOVP1_54 [uncultured Caudovirales phage]|uniref:Uncharacterized protein n=1 Tax=uncultured Caudovirales phage TaxID=2100421 RepID=A0A6J5KL66_9CAUD|nr:hypothetical protein UFOVP1_54 [uncultured Caudovirales phage]
MANTKNSTILVESERHVVYYYTLVSDGSQETGTAIHTSSTVAASLGIADPKNCKINSIKVIAQSAAGVIELYFNASTNVLALPIPLIPAVPFHLNFENEGGLQNYAGSGITGNIVYTTTGLASGDKFVIILDVRPS